MIPLEAQDAIRTALAARLRRRVKVDLFTQRQTALVVPGREPCVVCPDTEELVADIARLSPMVTLTLHTFGANPTLERRLGVRRVPAIVLRGSLNRPVVFFGIPLPPLFASVLNALELVSLEKVPLPAAVLGRLHRLRDEVHLQVLVANAAEFCQEMVDLAFTFGAACKQVQVEVIELGSFPSLAERLAPSHVPFTTINERTSFAGLVSAETLMDMIVHTVSHPTVLVERPETLGMTPLAPPTREQPAGRYQPNQLPSGLYVP